MRGEVMNEVASDEAGAPGDEDGGGHAATIAEAGTFRTANMAAAGAILKK
jgi:hypothetical protein